MNLSPHFTLEEFTHSQAAVRSGIDNTPDEATVDNLTRVAALLETVRSLMNGHPILISSGYRCVPLNKKIGGARSSRHVDGLAVDFTCPGFGTPFVICQQILNAGVKFDQMIFEGTWVHISLASADNPLRNQMLTAVFHPGKVTSYLVGLIDAGELT